MAGIYSIMAKRRKNAYSYVTLSLHLSNGPLKLCVVLYVIYVGGWLGVQRIRHGRRGGGFVIGGEIYYLQHISYLVYQAHTLQLTHGISDNRTHETYGSPRGTNNITANKL